MPIEVCVLVDLGDGDPLWPPNLEDDRRVMIDLVQAEVGPRYRVVPGNGRTM